MNIYTKTGDKGQTSLFDNKRVSKDDLRVESYGTIDELNSFLGLAKNYIVDKEAYEVIHGIQRKLFDIGAELATANKEKIPVITDENDIKYLEDMIDKYMSMVKKPNKFVIPGEGKGPAFLHVSRTVCRRAERRIISLANQEEINPYLIKYINRLSDFLYALSRYVEEGYEEIEFNK